MASVLFAFGCGPAATNTTNNANANKAMNTNSNMSTPVSMTTPSNNAAPMNSTANKTTTNTKATNTKDTAANKPAKPRKGDTFLCKDGTYSDAKTSQGACSGHGGIDHPVKP